jgi:hypothetical protein
MKAYVQYLDYSPVTGNLYEPCGDRAVVILDGRRNLSGWIEDAHECNGFRRPKYPHFQIMSGDFRQSHQIYTTQGEKT